MPDTTRIAALDMLTTAGGSAYLSELYGRVIQNVQRRLVSDFCKNKELSGDPQSGTLIARRFKNAASAAYGTARTAGAGSAVVVDDVPIQINVDREFVEELEEKDVRLLGVDGVMEMRARNHAIRMAAELDKAFFAAQHAAANGVSLVESASIESRLEAVIQACETVHNNFVDGVDRDQIRMILCPEYYGLIREKLDAKPNANISTAEEEFEEWHGVAVKSSTNLPVGCKMQVCINGATAQPVMTDTYRAEKIQLSNAYGVSLFFSYGTKVCTPDLVFEPSYYTQTTVADATAFASNKANLYVFNATTGEYENQANGSYSSTATYYTKNS